jgi:hypothetical protein
MDSHGAAINGDLCFAPRSIYYETIMRAKKKRIIGQSSIEPESLKSIFRGSSGL